MKTSETPGSRTPPAKPIRLRSVGLYGEVGVLPVSRPEPPAFQHPKALP